MVTADRENSGKWILVADDEPSVLEFVERALQYAGFSVTVAADGNSALEALVEREYDLLLTDIVMPDLDGIALSLKAAKDFPAMKIMMMSAYANQRQRAHNLDFLAHKVISKPFTLEELVAQVTEALTE